MSKLIRRLVWATVIFSALAVQAHTYKYSDLIIKDYDEMNRQVQIRISNSKKAGPDNEADALDELEDALRLIFARPNTDNMVAKLTPDVRRELGSYSAFESTISKLANEQIGILSDKKNTVSQRSTALFILENLLAEIQPESKTNAELKKVVKTVADADLEIKSDVKNDRKLRSMMQTNNPSEIARKMLKAMDTPPKK